MTRNYVPRKVTPRRSLRVSTWLTHVEKTRLEEAAAIAGTTMAALVRDVVLGAAREIVEEAERGESG